MAVQCELFLGGVIYCCARLAVLGGVICYEFHQAVSGRRLLLCSLGSFLAASFITLQCEICLAV